MKHSTVYLVIIVVFLGCKKGEEDPFISLKSRNGRITGSWVLIEENYTNESTSSLGTSTETRTFDGTTRTYQGTLGGVPYSLSFAYSRKITIEKEGTYFEEIMEDGDTETKTGYWWWLKNGKKKTRIALDDDDNSFELVRLTNKELITRTYQKEHTEDAGYTYTTTQEGTYTYEKEK